MYNPRISFNPRQNGGGDAASIGVKTEPSSFAEAEGEYVLSLRDFFRILLGKIWLVALVTVALGGVAVTFSLAQTPTYEASIMILVGQERVSGDSPREDVQDLQRLTQTMAEGIDTKRVAKEVIRQLNLQMSPKDFSSHLTVEPLAETQFIQVSYEDSSPEEAQQVANTIGDVFSEQVSEVSPSASAITATVWEQAEIPEEPVSPKTARNTVIALLLGLILGTGLAFLLELLDDSWRSPEEVEQITGVPTFGVVPKRKVLTGTSRRGDGTKRRGDK